MLKILTVLLGASLCASSGFSQNFEGTIKWTYTLTANDTALAVYNKDRADKLSKEEAQSIIARKAAVMPSSLTLKTQKGNMLSTSETKLMKKTFGDMLYLKDSSKTYLLNHDNKTYTTQISLQRDSIQGTPRVIATNETIKILGYTCKKHLVYWENTVGDQFTTHVWATTEVKDISTEAFIKLRMGGRSNGIRFAGVEGIPLKVSTTQGYMTTVMEVTQLSKEVLDPKLFLLPKNYTKSE